MAQTKHPMPDDLKQRCLSIVKGYDRMTKEYFAKREEIARLLRQCDDYSACEKKLNWLESRFDTMAIKAVEQAKLCIGIDVDSERERAKIADAVWDSCIEGRNFVYEYRALCVGKTNFYKRRREFLYSIAENLGFL